MNQLKIEAYSSGTTRISDPNNDLINASGLRFATGYAGGLYLDGSFYVPRAVLDYLAVQGTQRVIFRNGMKIVYEGYVDELVSELGDTDQGVTVGLIGAWGYHAMRRHHRKLWADKRLTDDIWKYISTATGAEKCTVDRQSRIRFTPKSEDWGDGEYAAVRYVMPTGQTIKRIVYSWAFAEAAQAWEISAWRSTDGAAWTQMATFAVSGDTYTTGTTTIITDDTVASGSIDVALATASQYMELRFYSRAAQTGASDGGTFGQFSAITVYSELGAINVTEITKDVRAWFAEINSDESFIGSNTLSLVPFIIDRWTPYADILTQAAEFGDSSFNRWAVGFKSSELAATPNGEPVLFLEQFPALTDFDYAVRLDEQNVVAPFSIIRDYSGIYNYIIVEYADELGITQQLTSGDAGYSALDDDTSAASYGWRTYVLNVGSSTAAAAYNSGQRFLAAYKEPQWVLTGPITVMGNIRAKSGQLIPACEIVAGKRIKIENYLQDLSGTGLTFLISHTDYDDDSQTCAISIGPPSDVLFPRYIFERPMPVDVAATASDAAGTGGSGGGDRLNWKRRYGLKPGTPEWDEAVKLGKKAWEEKYKKTKK